MADFINHIIDEMLVAVHEYDNEHNGPSDNTPPQLDWCGPSVFRHPAVVTPIIVRYPDTEIKVDLKIVANFASGVVFVSNNYCRVSTLRRLTLGAYNAHDNTTSKLQAAKTIKEVG